MNSEDKMSGHPIRQFLDGRFTGLRVLDQPDNLSQGRLLSHLGRSKLEGPGFVHGAADHLIPTLFLHGKTLPREHRFVHGRVALDYQTIHGDSLSRPDQNDIVDYHFVCRKFNFLAVPYHSGHLGLQGHETADCLGGPAPSKRFQPAPQNDEGRQQSRRFKKNRFLSSKPRIGPEGVDHANQIRGPDSGSVEQVHIGNTAPEPVEAVLKELQGRSENHRSCQKE